MVVAWSMWCEKRVVNCEAGVSWSSVEVVDGGVLSLAAFREVVRVTRSGVIAWYS
jgi:hypothetical protein